MSWFSDAYRGALTENGMIDFHQRIDQRRVIIDRLRSPELWFWTPAFNEVMQWLKATIPVGSTVLDVGCGLGFFLHSLRNAGYNAVGLDVAEAAAILNRKDGFEVWQGTIETMPRGWQSPAAVVSFFLVHHLCDPRSFFAALRDRAPGASVAIAAYGPANKGSVASLPPRTMTRWNSQALGAALAREGYEVEIRDLRSTGSELSGMAWLRHVLGSRAARYPRLYRAAKVLEPQLLRLIPRGVRADAYVVLALGHPTPRP